MKATTGILIAGGVVGGALALRAYAQSRAPQGTSACDAVATLAGEAASRYADSQTGGGGEAADTRGKTEQAVKIACNVIDKIVDKVRGFVGGEGCLEKHPKNIQANGQPSLTCHPVLAAFLERDRSLGGPVFCSRPGVLRYGTCEPFRGDQPGMVRPGCAPGTEVMSGRGGAAQRQFLSGRLWNPATRTGDPFTREHTKDIGPFPLAVPVGARAFWVRGQPLVCKAGETLALDHRGESVGVPRCWPASSPPPTRREDPQASLPSWLDWLGLGGGTNPGTTTGTTTDHR